MARVDVSQYGWKQEVCMNHTGEQGIHARTHLYDHKAAQGGGLACLDVGSSTALPGRPEAHLHHHLRAHVREELAVGDTLLHERTHGGAAGVRGGVK